ncbi:hypothetical protein PR202_ga13451 [Eleusine coracana subsp. coracana]|uniref:Uncharacterized protein n=1 Tax=Eleusine coracana subsp. coracana TaxID=191504 RepID=A0AAV5CE27_ELECO|nr:hypothetical protein PR202_ga13451 [Eleusine coracana subsp. coracana]
MDEKREADLAAPRRTTAASSGTPTASRCSSMASSSSSNTNAATAIVPWAGGAGDSCYYPGCRKVADCDCEMCLASIDATRDLVRAPEAASARRFSARDRRRRHSLSPRDARRRRGPMTSPSPGRRRCSPRPSPGGRPPARDAAAAAKGFGPKLSPEAVARVGAEAQLAPGGLGNKLRVLERRVGQLVRGDRVANCSSQDSEWRFHQNDQRHVFQWRCTVYKSAAEEVSVWGSPLRTSGLLPSTLSARHLTLLAGEITEWSDRRVLPTARASNGSSWAYRRHSAAAVRLEPETWVLEYQKSVLFEGTRLIPAAAELFASKCSTAARRVWRRLARRRIPGGAQAIPT